MTHSDESTRYRILDTAGGIFADKGYEKATIREISSQAHVNLGAINYHFGDKAGLYVQTLFHAHDVVFDQIPLPDWDENTSPRQKLADFIRTMVKRLHSDSSLPWQTRLIMREMVLPTDACRELAEKVIRPHHDQLMGIIREFYPGEIPEFRCRQIAFSIVSQSIFYKTNRSVIEILVPRDDLEQHFDPDQLADHIIAFSLAALEQHDLFHESSSQDSTKISS